MKKKPKQRATIFTIQHEFLEDRRPVNRGGQHRHTAGAEQKEVNATEEKKPPGEETRQGKHGRKPQRETQKKHERKRRG